MWSMSKYFGTKLQLHRIIMMFFFFKLFDTLFRDEVIVWPKNFYKLFEHFSNIKLC